MLAATCSFEALDSLIRDKIICGTWDHPLQKQLLREGDLTFDRCLDMECTAEASKERMKAIGNTTAPEVHGLSQHHRRAGGQVSISILRYFYREMQHEQVKEKCPALGQYCEECGKMNHCSSVCQRRGRSQKDLVRLVHEGDGTSVSGDVIMTLSWSS